MPTYRITFTDYRMRPDDGGYFPSDTYEVTCSEHELNAEVQRLEADVCEKSREWRDKKSSAIDEIIEFTPVDIPIPAVNEGMRIGEERKRQKAIQEDADRAAAERERELRVLATLRAKYPEAT